MLPIKRRIKKDSFSKIMKEGVFVHSDNVYLRFLDRKDQLSSLFTFVVPVKVKKTSVGRHLIKRQMTAVLEKFLLTVKSGFSVIIIAKKDLSSLPYTEIEKEIIKLLMKAQILNEEAI